MAAFNGLDLGSIAKLSQAKTRSITAENVYGEKGKGGMAEMSATPPPEVVWIGQRWDGLNLSARDLGRKWKVRPCITLPGGAATTIMDVDGPGCIQHIWFTVNKKSFRDLILRMYWDGEENPSVESPIGDFFCNWFNTKVNLLALPINLNPLGGFNCYFPMPFRKHARVTLENRSPKDYELFFYAIDYALTELDPDDAYFHAQFRQINPLPHMTNHVILDGVRGQGHYVGTCLSWRQINAGWRSEGEIEFFLDGEAEFPTISGIGIEDYFGDAPGLGQIFSAPFLGHPLGACDSKSSERHGFYRFHIMDPIRFASSLRAIVQAIGWRSEGRSPPSWHSIASVAYWYQAEPHAAFPPLAARDCLEIT